MTAQKRASSSKKNQSARQQQKQETLSSSRSHNSNISSSVQQLELGPSGAAPQSPRLPNTTVCLPIVYGSIAFFLGKKADEYHTHRWTLYVRGPNHEDLSVAISKVIFHLHPSFPQPVRELTSAPFEVTEKGWGEFEATIRIVWRDPSERATVLTHFIKLYPPGLQTITPSTNPNTKEPVVHENYDEVVFTDPTEFFHRELRRWSLQPKITSREDSILDRFCIFSDEEDVRKLIAAQKFLDEEVKNVKDRILRCDREKIEIEKNMKGVAQSKVSGISAESGGGVTATAVGKAPSTAINTAAKIVTNTTTKGKMKSPLANDETGSSAAKKPKIGQ